MPGTALQPLARAREAFEGQAWTDAHREFDAADQESPLPPEDLERFSMAAALIGREDEGADLLARTHQEYLRAGRPDRAARAAAFLALSLLGRGEIARATGWLARTQRLLDRHPPESAEWACALLPLGLQRLFGGDPTAAHDLFARAAEIGHLIGDADVATLGAFGRGRSLVAMGRIAEGMASLDEAMVAVTAGEVSPIFAGVVYCGVVTACWETFDLPRAQEWTDALTAWCAAQPDLALFRGDCLVHRAELMLLHGAWPDALHELQRVQQQHIPDPRDPAWAEALYQQGELHRLRGELDLAEEAFRRASRVGRSPQPGLALLRLAQGDPTSAAAALRREVEQAGRPLERSRLLAALVETMLAIGDLPAAGTAAAELAHLAEQLDAPYLRAVAAYATGAVDLARGDARGALTSLRRAASAWYDLGAPYEAARARLLTALACRRLDDRDTAVLDLDAARATFEQLGALPDLERLEALTAAPPQPPAAGSARLTPREIEVLRLVASGKTNRAIGADLVLSEKTVARHIANIFTKLNLSSRAAATAYAYEHHLV